MESQPPTRTEAHRGDLSHVPYDLNRAAACFEGDVETGYEIAEAFYRWMTAIAGLWEGEPLTDAFWLAVMSNSYTALVEDFAAQVREAKEARGAQ